MKFQQVYERCEAKGIKITRMGLYKAGLQNGFIIKKSGGNIFVQEDFEKWMEKKLEKVPEGYCSFKECSEKMNIPLDTIYYLIKESNLKTIEIGTKKVKYVKIEEFREFVRIRKHGSEEKYGN